MGGHYPGARVILPYAVGRLRVEGPLERVEAVAPKTLEEYGKKRDFRKTLEPPGDLGGPGSDTLFVIQKHDARQLHYDLRLESDGVLKSWAVPKGPSMNPRDKRLAVPTEDHPLSYADFEGVIPKGEYGAGTVEVWDRGVFVNLKPKGETNSITANKEEGLIEVWIEGEKLKGGFALVRTKEGKDETWLLVKMRDSEAGRDGNPVEDLPDSVLTGRTLDEIAAGKGYLPEDPPNVRVSINGRKLALTNLNKVLYPEARFSKADVLNYYMGIAPYIMPHLESRLLTMKRYPDGVEGDFFYEKSCPGYKPDWLAVTEAGSSKKVAYCTIEDQAGLVWIANLASLELHVMLSRSDDVSKPTMVVFDLDPGEGMDILDCSEAAGNLRTVLAGLGLKCFAKTSGGKGLHVLVPLNTPASFQETKDFAHAVALMMQERHPDAIVSNMRKALRKRKIFVDWSQNDRHKTTVCAYSLRAQPRPTVSAPVTWEELDSAVGKKDKSLLYFEAADVLERVRKEGDLFKPVVVTEQGLPELARTRR
jgi:bifunctional non-homologous end joining protein LigD